MQWFRSPPGVLVVCLLTGLVFQSVAAERRNLEAAASSPEELVRGFLAALSHDDLDQVRRLAVTEEEFATYIWPELPAAAPDRNLTVQFVWNNMNVRSQSNLRHLMDALGGQRLELEELRFTGKTTEYATYRIHRNSELVVRDRTGKISIGRLFGSVLELDGQFKILSFNN
jgi:hypothetical protein